jgi:hypothetical protein
VLDVYIVKALENDLHKSKHVVLRKSCLLIYWVETVK